MASRLGGVYRPSGQYPWSSVPNRKTNSPFRSGRWIPFTMPLDIVRNPV